MSRLERSSLSFLGLVAVSGALALGGCRAHTQERPVAVSPRAATFTVDGQVALHSLMALSDAHLQKLADDMRLLAATDAARSADWERIRTPLTAAARMNVPAVNWFALPDGSYWSVQESREAGNLSDRPYWPGLLAGQTVVGDLVISRATGRNTAIVAVPVRGDENAVVGVLGASVHLDSLSARIKQEMDLEPNHLFYSLDTEPLVGLHIDPETIFLHPLEEGDPDVDRAMQEILSHEEGFVSYTFRGKRRDVLYSKSPVTGWWYAFGVVQQ
jgi:methyl-accepting chemotaxis protein